jgi:hypothetical protein
VTARMRAPIDDTSPVTIRMGVLRQQLAVTF